MYVIEKNSCVKYYSISVSELYYGIKIMSGMEFRVIFAHTKWRVGQVSKIKISSARNMHCLANFLKSSDGLPKPGF